MVKLSIDINPLENMAGLMTAKTIKSGFSELLWI